MSGDASQRVQELCRRYSLHGRQELQLSRILTVIAEDGQAPTSVREPEEAVDVHLADSLVALELRVVREAASIVDIGAGAGFPGLALAVALPDSEVKLVDSQARKRAFAERVADAAGIENAQAVCARVEEWPEGIGVHDLALARAVAPQPIVLEYAAPLLRLGGVLVDWRGKRDPREEQAAAEAAEILGLERDAICKVEPFEGVRDHHLHIYSKARETPDRFPRRSGMARKKPLVT
jgi:16S rRNA (guanine527-N7)-methyltransferase